MKPVAVVGGGIAGIQAALDLANQGIKVYLIEKTPSIGGRMAQLDKTFPTLDCSMCILTPRMVEVARNKNIELLTYCELLEVKGEAGNFKLKVRKKPRYVDIDKCTGCMVCFKYCPSKVPDEYNEGMSERKAIYIPFPQSVPLKATIDAEHCLWFQKGICRNCEKFCPAKAIDYNQKPEDIELEVAAVIFATGYDIIMDADFLREQYGYGIYANVYTNLEFERIVSATGPTGGEILRRSDKKHPKKIAFIQCVCSRDARINPNCSAVCCMASVKEAILTKEHMHDVEVAIFYMDLRAFGKGYQEFYDRAREEFGIRFIRSKPAKIVEDPNTKNLIIYYEDTQRSKFVKEEFDMVVLAVGVRARQPDSFVPVATDSFAQLKDPVVEPFHSPIPGIFVVGMLSGPKDIPDSVVQASAAAMKASLLAFSR